MKKLFIIVAICFSAIAYGQDTKLPYSLSLHVGYAHNLTYGSYANVDVDAFMPINPHFEMEANVRASTANFYVFGVQLRPTFALPIGELYIEDRLMANLLKRDNFNDFVHALSLGYRMQFVDVQLGFNTRFIQSTPFAYDTKSQVVCEPLDLLYRVEARVRPASSPWNISMSIANVDDYQIERMWQPMMHIAGWYDINEHWRVRLTGKLKSAGVFNLNAHYYASELRAGMEYRF